MVTALVGEMSAVAVRDKRLSRRSELWQPEALSVSSLSTPMINWQPTNSSSDRLPGESIRILYQIFCGSTFTSNKCYFGEGHRNRSESVNSKSVYTGHLLSALIKICLPVARL